MVAPLVLTLRLDKQSFERFESERRTLFPPERNLVPAHISIFHALPGEAEDAVHHSLSEVSSTTQTIELQIHSLKSLGRGVAYNVRSSHLTMLQSRLVREFSGFLTRQDQQPYHPHITLQNKVSPDEARATLAELSSAFVPFQASGIGLCLWEYLKGPWKLRSRYSFLPAEIAMPGPLLVE